MEENYNSKQFITNTGLGCRTNLWLSIRYSGIDVNTSEEIYSIYFKEKDNEAHLIADFQLVHLTESSIRGLAEGIGEHIIKALKIAKEDKGYVTDGLYMKTDLRNGIEIHSLKKKE